MSEFESNSTNLILVTPGSVVIPFSANQIIILFQRIMLLLISGLILVGLVALTYS
ncbi:hypothetical protein [Ekhidna sp.]|uniref:hypothetical protein n=1 Tax=Ekhidna sp. TaxID=2608089 RepID=UPI003C7996F1